jgi:hypothetical protein
MTNLIINKAGSELQDETDLLSSKVQRRSFLRYAGTGAVGLALVAAACKKDKLGDGLYLGSGDVGILNYAYVLEQLEAAFYMQVTQAFYTGATDAEKALLTDIRDHELAHREFFKNALGETAIPSIEFDFSTINFGSRDNVLETARAFEDLGVSAYNGAGVLIKKSDYLILAAKIVSVEARHAALIRDLINSGSFASSDVIDLNGLDKSRIPSEVLEIAGKYIKTKLNADDLPTL